MRPFRAQKKCFATPIFLSSNPWKFKGRFSHFAGEFCVTYAAALYARVSTTINTPWPCRGTPCASSPPDVAGPSSTRWRSTVFPANLNLETDLR